MNSKKKIFQSVCILLAMLFLIIFSLHVHAQTTSQTVEKINLSKFSSLLESYKGKVVIVNFWALDCKACKMEMPLFMKLYNRYKKNGLIVLIISINPNDKAESLQKFLQNNKIYFTTYVVDDLSIYKHYKIHEIPLTLIFDKNGKQISKHVSFDPEKTEKEIIQDIQNILGFNIKCTSSGCTVELNSDK